MTREPECGKIGGRQVKRMGKGSLKEYVLKRLRESGRISGEKLAEETGFSRTYIWKAVCALRRDGYNIEATQNCGYRLVENTDVLAPETLRKLLIPELRAAQLEFFDAVDSTNNVCKKLAESGCPEWTMAFAREQTAGRGRNDHTFFSPPDTGLYMSAVLRPAIAAGDAVLLTAAAAVAVAKALEKICGVKAGIKWVNDIYIDGKKVCGILAEASLKPGKECPEYVILGIGINVSPPKGGFPDEIKDTAASVAKDVITDLKSRVAAEVLNELYSYCQCLSFKGYYKDYKKRCFVLKKRVTFEKDGECVTATAVGITKDFELIVRDDNGKRHVLNSGEISVKT